MAITYRTAPTAPIKWNEQRVISRLVGGEGSAFPYRRYICVPNVSWGFLEYEADLLVASKKGFLKEVEVKISVADLRSDLKKKKHALWDNDNHPIHEFYYAMPALVWEAVKDNPPIPDYAGVIVLHDVSVTACHEYKRPAKRMKRAQKLTAESLAALSRLGVMRYWALLHKEQVTQPTPEHPDNGE